MKNEAAAGSLQGLHLVVRDIDGPGPERSDYETFLSFSDPDGNSWLVQEVPSRPT